MESEGKETSKPIFFSENLSRNQYGGERLISVTSLRFGSAGVFFCDCSVQGRCAAIKLCATQQKIDD